MLPRFLPGDVLLVETFSGQTASPRTGDVVIARPKPLNGLPVIKRVASPDAADGFALSGDNPSRSLDSRQFGAVSAGEIAGRVRAFVWPPRRWFQSAAACVLVWLFSARFACAAWDPSEAKQSVDAYVSDVIDEEGGFFIEEEKTERVRELKWAGRFLDVAEQEGILRVRAAMNDAETGEAVDLEFDLEPFEESWEVVDARIISPGAGP